MSFTGTACGNIQSLVKNITERLHKKFSMVYIDSDHTAFDHPPVLDYHTNLVWTNRQTVQQLSVPGSLNKFDRHLSLLNYDVIFLNGNHHPGNHQVVFLDEKKTTSLQKRVDQLTNILAFVDVDGQSAIPDFISDKMDTTRIPVFGLNEAEAFTRHLENQVTQSIAPLKALILAGGKSTRMGQNKALLNYHGASQLEQMVQLTESLGLETYVSSSREQDYAIDATVIQDAFVGMGPLGAILSAFKYEPNTAWLVLAVDLPYLTQNTLSDLMQQRAPQQVATAYLNHETGFAEPLVAIYEPKAYTRMLQFLALGYSCPRKVLINSDTCLVEPREARELTNVNTPEEFEKARNAFANGE